ncbi:MAG: hypothetical protein M3Z66_06375 [Chloroflexota bacterium]|nr:hypothetical protein [Chloroflexota bacterium]
MLFELHRVFVSPFDWGLRYRKSSVVPSYDDSEAWDGFWTVGLRYRLRSTTRAGGLRLTVYRIPGSQNLPEPLARMPRGAVQYAYPVVDRKSADTAIWQFNAAPKGTFYYKVDILGKRPCGYWYITYTTN